MSAQNKASNKRILFWIGGAILLPAALFIGGVLVNSIPLAAARPPRDLQTLEQFKAWKKEAILGTGTAEFSGITYTVMLAPPGRYLASGPSAYLFDAEGRFVDWTSDMGDLSTVKHRFHLSSGKVTNIKMNKR